MRAKEKAKELVLKMHDNVQDATAGMFEKDVPYVDARFKAAKGAALIAVNELIKDNEAIVNKGLNKTYWEQVKTEIEKL